LLCLRTGRTCGSEVTSTLSIGVQWRDSQAALGNLSAQIPEAVAAGLEAASKNVCSATLQVLVSQIERGHLGTCRGLANEACLVRISFTNGHM